MKKILLISDEKTPDDNGFVTDCGEYGIISALDGEKTVYNISNLRAKLALLGDFEITSLHHSEIGKAADFLPDYVVLSGRFTAWDNDGLETEYGELLKFIREVKAPVFGICAGLQLIAKAFGACVAPMEDISGEHGFVQQQVVSRHPMLAGLNDRFDCMELHCDEVKELPAEFELIASTEKCHIQMIAHKSRPIFGTQFHPELQSAKVRDGDILLKNFFSQH